MPTRMFLIDLNYEDVLREIDRPVFSKGDSYLVVSDEAQKIWVWHGSKATMDERSGGAILAQRLKTGDWANYRLGTADENDEPREFLHILGGLHVVDADYAASILQDVDKGETIKEIPDALYQVDSEGVAGDINAIRYIQVPFVRESLDGEDAFIVDTGETIWVWQGKTCNVKEKVKAIQYARQFDAERAGVQKVIVVLEGEEPPDFPLK